MLNEPGKTKSEISSGGKLLAGILLIAFILFPIWLIMAYWPTSIPNPADKLKIKPLYIKELYHVRLACIPDSVCCIEKLPEGDTTFNERAVVKEDTVALKRMAAYLAVIDSLKKGAQDSAVKRKTDSINLELGRLQNNLSTVRPMPPYYTRYNLIDFSTLVLILVAAAGFLGNMIHVATSFTTFVGNEAFKRSWLLWYFVKPFTASALALGLYFVFRGGFLNYTADATNINLYGILTISVFAGLFTDKATLKLGEIFEVVFGAKTGDKRTDKLTITDPKIASVSPEKLLRTGPNNIVLKGENLNKAKFSFTINGEAVLAAAIKTTATSITILYNVPATPVEKTNITLQVLDEKGIAFFSKIFPVE